MSGAAHSEYYRLSYIPSSRILFADACGTIPPLVSNTYDLQSGLV